MLPTYNQIIKVAESLVDFELENTVIIIKLPPKRYKKLEEEFFYRKNPSGILTESDDFLVDILNIPFLFIDESKEKSDINKSLNEIIKFKESGDDTDNENVIDNNK